MFHIFFNADENYIRYTAVLITSIVENTDTNKSFRQFCQASAFKAEKGSFLTSYENLDFDKLDENMRGGVTAFIF